MKTDTILTIIIMLMVIFAFSMWFIVLPAGLYYKEEITLDEYKHVLSYYVEYRGYPYLERDMADGKISNWEMGNIRAWYKNLEAEEEQKKIDAYKQKLNKIKSKLMTAEKGN